jgi:hypothetical protein
MITATLRLDIENDPKHCNNVSPIGRDYGAAGNLVQVKGMAATLVASGYKWDMYTSSVGSTAKIREKILIGRAFWFSAMVRNFQQREIIDLD